MTKPSAWKKEKRGIIKTEINFKKTDRVRGVLDQC